MIREFWVENFYSIKDRQILNFETKGNKDSIASVMIDDKVRLNKIAVIYGANASGKTNFLLAIRAIFSLLVTPKGEKSKKIRQYKPFALLDGEPTNMFISFYCDKVKYDYSISFGNQYIYSEELYYYPNGTKALFYKRKFVSESEAATISFGSSLGLRRKTEDAFVRQTLNNHTVLSTYLKTSFEEKITLMERLSSWIENYVHDIDGDAEDGETFSDMMRKVSESPEMKKFYLQMISKADFNIVDFHYEEAPMFYTEKEKKFIIENQSIPEQIKNNLLEGKRKDIVFTSNAGNDNFDLKIADQSSGTLSFMMKLRLLYDMLTGSHIYLLDELEEDLHYDLFLFYINSFLYNSSDSQLIISSHLTSLLAEDMINEERDLIYFVEKDKDTASSSCKRADKLGLHKNQSLYNAYKIGRLGAKPSLGSPFILVG